MLPAELLDSNARLGVLEDCDDLFLRVPFPCYGPLLWSPSQHNRTSKPMVEFSGGRSNRRKPSSNPGGSITITVARTAHLGT